MRSFQQEFRAGRKYLSEKVNKEYDYFSSETEWSDYKDMNSTSTISTTLSS